jgi:hypothetical protein
MVDDSSDFQIGNIAKSSAENDHFNQWSLGDFVKWSAAVGESLSSADATMRFGLRYTEAIEVKWSHHQAGESRKNGWAPPGTGFTLGILISGAFLEQFRPPGSKSPPHEIRLENGGDYVAWRSALFEHNWQALKESDFLTIRWWDPNHPRS